MSDSYVFRPQLEKTNLDLSIEEIRSVLYHDIFDYPLNFQEIIKWKTGTKVDFSLKNKEIISFKGHYLVSGKRGSIYKRVLRNRISQRKIKIAKEVSKILSSIPSVQMIALTGSLAMNNSEENGDIDLLIATKENSLWTTRALILVALKLMSKPMRRFGDNNQKDKFCLNMWFDRSDLIWPSKSRNIYSAHEIAQIVPLVNKNKTYELFLQKNKWILDYWPKAVRIKKEKRSLLTKSSESLIEKIFYKFQYTYMKSKITREVVTKTRAIFHPQDWTGIVTSRL